MMKIPIERLRRDPEPQFSFHGTQEKLGLQGLGFPIQSADVGVRAIEADGGYFLTGHFSGIAQIECHRCLEEFEQVLEVELGVLIAFEMREEFEGEDGIIEVSPEAREVDITKYVSDSILLSLPYKKVCKEDCAGLCAQCGTNLNYDSCDCGQDQIDPRWEKLKELNFDQEGE